MNNNVEVLKQVLDVLEEEKRNFYNLLNQNEFRIEEINSYLRNLSKGEDEDYKVFSPRNIENTHREQIEADENEKKSYEEKNAEYYKKIEFLKKLIDKVNIVISNLQSKEEKKEDYISELSNVDDSLKCIKKIKMENKHISHQIMNCISFITPDPERAKVELTALAKKLSDNI